MARVVVIGSSNTDLVTRGPLLPEPGQTVLHREFLQVSGGKGANQAVAAARAGAEVTFVGAVGADAFGADALNALRDEGIDIGYMQQIPDAKTGVALIMVDYDGRNMISVAAGANLQLTPEHVQAAAESIRNAQMMLASLEVPPETIFAAAEIARDAHVPIILNPAPAPHAPLTREQIGLVDYLTPNESEFAALIGRENDSGNERSWHEAILSLLGQGPKALLLTLAERGVTVFQRSGARNHASYEVQVVDTTAAGDAFNGALAVAMAEGKQLDEAIQFAQAAAALSVTKSGAQTSLPTRKAIDRFLAGGPVQRTSGRLPQAE